MLHVLNKCAKINDIHCIIPLNSQNIQIHRQEVDSRLLAAGGGGHEELLLNNYGAFVLVIRNSRNNSNCCTLQCN
jgi:hypothetical protein